MLAPRIAAGASYMGCALSKEEIMRDLGSFYWETACAAHEITLGAVRALSRVRRGEDEDEDEDEDEERGDDDEQEVGEDDEVWDEDEEISEGEDEEVESAAEESSEDEAPARPLKKSKVGGKR